jgi:hypothetical protein
VAKMPGLPSSISLSMGGAQSKSTNPAMRLSETCVRLVHEWPKSALYMRSCVHTSPVATSSGQGWLDGTFHFHNVILQSSKHGSIDDGQYALPGKTNLTPGSECNPSRVVG